MIALLLEVQWFAVPLKPGEKNKICTTVEFPLAQQ